MTRTVSMGVDLDTDREVGLEHRKSGLLIDTLLIFLPYYMFLRDRTVGYFRCMI